MTTFFIGDTHFGHKGIITFNAANGKPIRDFASIEEHDEELVRRWNDRVKKNDTVWHLGDFCFGARNIVIAGRLNGIKKLVMGNHDMFPTAKYLEHFDKCYGVASMKPDLILTHVPVHESQRGRFRRNIHGHLHHHDLQNEFYVNVSVEQIGLTPIAYEELEKMGRL